MHQALVGGFASSRVLEVHGKRTIKRAFSAGFRIGLHREGPRLALQPAPVLDHHGAYSFLACLDDLVVAGPTFANVNDFRALLVT